MTNVQQANKSRVLPTNAAPAPQKQVQALKPTTPGDANAVASPAAIIAKLKSGAAFSSITPAQWQAVGEYLIKLPEAQRQKLSRDLMATGTTFVAQDGINEVSVISQYGQATIDLDHDEVRVTRNDNATLYVAGKAEETIKPRKDGKLVVVRNGETQIWDADTGKGINAAGKAIAPQMAERVVGEALRKPWPKALPSKLVEPQGDEDSPVYAKLYNDAIRKAGGQVLEPLQPDMDDAKRYNCHSYATTRGHGDLHDPFDNDYQPRWVNFPSYQLANGFKKLAADQKVHAGDVILYADSHGVPTHTGVVKAVDDDGNPTQVESKWGAYGLYVHAPFDIPAVYGHIDSFYRPADAK